jgi:surface antigen
VPDFRGDPYSSSWGQCVWWAAIKRLDERFKNLGGLAYQWAANAARHGFKTGTTPRVGATVIFQRGVDGASWWGGHAAHVEKLYSGGWFLISEMNFYAHGGGWDRVSYRYVHVGPGVSFIY